MEPRRSLDRYHLVASLLVLLLAAVVVLNGLGTFHTDIKPEVYLAPAQTLRRALWAWQSSPYLGSPNLNVGLVPVLAVTAALRALGLSPEWTFKVLHLALWLLAAAGAHRLTRTVAPRAGRWAALAAAAAYLVNPYTVQAGATLAIALPMALLPWQLLCLVRALARPDGWAWPAAFGLTFAAMSGMNVAVVPLLQLLAVVPVVLAARRWYGTGWAVIARVLGRCALFVLGLGLYWLLPGIAARATGTQIVSGSESLTGIAQVSSFTEVLRGTGLWPLYGYDQDGPWVPEHAAYVANPTVMLLTMLWPVLGLLALQRCRGPLRSALSGALLLSAVVMVGMFPGEPAPASPAGRVAHAVLSTPLGSAFRTTNKIGAVLALSLALALGVAAARVLPVLWRRPGAPPVVATVLGAALVAWGLPAFTGRLYTSPMEVPGYWHRAAAAADAGDPASTTLLLPGQVRPAYTWTRDRPDDLPPSLLRRDAVLPETTPNASPPAVNLLAALDDAVQSGVAPAGTVSAFARYLGADRVLLRHDLDQAAAGGAAPADTAAGLAADPGLSGPRLFGDPGENVPVSAAADDPGHGLAPLELFTVRGPRTAARAQSTDGTLLVSGDAFALPRLAAAGLLRRDPTVRYLQDLDPAALAAALPTVGRVVVTDTNARRSVVANRLTAGHGPLLAPDEHPAATRTLGDSPDDQTVLERTGPRVSATSSGAAFFEVPYGIPEMALDGDPATAWRFGDFGRGAGQRLTIDLPAPAVVGRVGLAQLPSGSALIDRVTVAAGNRRASVRLPDRGRAEVDLGGVRADRVTVTVDSLRGDGYNLVALAEVDLPGVAPAGRVGRLPTTLADRAARLDPAARQALAATPLSVLLSRVRNTPSPGNDSEPGLRRVVTLPSPRTFDASASVRVDADLDHAYDAVAGHAETVRARSSRFWFDDPGLRASMAADGNPSTTWSPGGRTRGSWWELTGPRRRLEQVRITQQVQPDRDANRVDRVTLAVDGRQVAAAAVGPGTTTVDLPPGTTGSALRMTVVGVAGPEDGTPPRFPEIETGARMLPAPPGPYDRPGRPRCLPVATAGGSAVWMRPTTARLAGRADAGTPWQGCAPVTLGAGRRAVGQADGFVLDSLELHQGRTRPVGTAPRARVLQSAPGRRVVQVSAADGPYAVLAGTGFDPRWRATADGEDLGAPVLLDGWSVGWLLPDGRPRTVTMTFGPQRTATAALGASALVLLLALGLVARAALRRRRSAPAPAALAPSRSLPATPAPRWPRPAAEAGLVATGWFLVGLPGLLTVAAVVLATRRRPVAPDRLVRAGAALVMTSMVVWLILLGSERSVVSAGKVAASLWPHRLAGAGLLLATLGAAWAQRFPRAPVATDTHDRGGGEA